MLARKCDFCGNLYEHYNGCDDNDEKANAIMFVDRNLEDSYCEWEIYDMCPECINKLLTMMRKEK